MKRKYIYQLPAMLALLVGMVACNTDYPNLLKETYPGQDLNAAGKNSKVLYVIVDGLNGDALKEFSDAELPNIAEMKDNSLYSMNTLSDYEDQQMSYQAAWTNLLTGVTSSKHGVKSDWESDNFAQYPSIITRLKQINSNNRAAVLSRNEEFVQHLAKDADVKETLSTDALILSKTQAELGKDDAQLVVANFAETEEVGAAGGYTLENAAYRQAIVNLDKSVGELLASIKKRANFGKENWLIVFTSSQGANLANSQENVAYNDLNRNTFTIFYSPKFNEVPVPKPDVSEIPYVDNAVTFNGALADNNTALIPNDNGLYNFGTGDFSIRFTMRGSGVSSTWPVFLSKGGRIDDSNPGWRLYISRELLSIQVGGNSSWSNWGTNLVVNDGKWHNVVVVFYTEGGVRYVKAFVDGVKSTAIQNINSRGSLTTNEPLRVGRNQADANLPDIKVTNLQIYNTALSDDFIKSYACKITPQEESTYAKNLVGYWPMNEGSGRVLHNAATAAKGKDLVLQGKVNWEAFSEYSSALCPAINQQFYKLVPNAVDATYIIYSWMGVTVLPTWNLDGKVWPFTYNNVRP